MLDSANGFRRHEHEVVDTAGLTEKWRADPAAETSARAYKIEGFEVIGAPVRLEKRTSAIAVGASISSSSA